MTDATISRLGVVNAVKTVTFNKSEAGGLDKLWDVLDATAQVTLTLPSK